MKLSEDQPQPPTTQPGDDDICLVEPGGNQQRIVRSLLKLYQDFTPGDHDIRRAEGTRPAVGLERVVDVVLVADVDELARSANCFSRSATTACARARIGSRGWAACCAWPLTSAARVITATYG
jgi:hypothetical protein